MANLVVESLQSFKEALEWKMSKNRKLSVDMTIGTIMGIDATTGLLVPANGLKAKGTLVAPRSILCYADLPSIHAATNIEGKTPASATAKAGVKKMHEITQAVLGFAAGTFSLAQVSAKAPVYLASGGKLTLTPSTKSGDINHIVGYVYDTDLVVINLEIPNYTVVA